MGKLVRDKIPDIIRKNGEIPVTRTLSRAEAIQALFDKLIEEAAELRAAKTVQERVSEFADIREVLQALHNELLIPVRLVENQRRVLKIRRGAFRKRIYLERVE